MTYFTRRSTSLFERRGLNTRTRVAQAQAAAERSARNTQSDAVSIVGDDATEAAQHHHKVGCCVVRVFTHNTKTFSVPDEKSSEPHLTLAPF